MFCLLKFTFPLGFNLVRTRLLIVLVLVNSQIDEYFPSNQKFLTNCKNKLGAAAFLVPVTCRKQLYDIFDDMATKVDIQFYSDARDALLKAIVE